MGYTISPIIATKTYTPSDDIIIQNTPIARTYSTTYVKVKEITLFSEMGMTSLFRFKFSLWNASGSKTTYGKIYRNGIAVGTEHTIVGTTPTVFTEDIVTTSWATGDTIEIWIKTNDGSWYAYAQDFIICGVGSEFKNTLV